MDVFFWFGFVGAWLLFAGPVYQAALELREEGFDEDEQTALREQMSAMGRPEHINRWWWLLPPVAFYLNQRQSKQWRAKWAARLTPPQREKFRTFQQKAAGWLIVATGALFIAIKESGELVEHSEWPEWTLIPMLAVPFLMSVGFTVNRIGQRQKDARRS